jgi:hypothetical protein
VAVADYALCARDDVREVLQKQDVEVDQDDLIDREIDRASWVIMEHCGRFKPVEAAGTEKRYVVEGGRRPRGGYTVDLFPFYASAVTAVVLDPDGSSPQTLAATDWRPRPLGALDGMYRTLKLPNVSLVPEVEYELEVTGTWGFADVPPSVIQAAAITVVEWIRKDVQAFSTAYLAGEERLDRPEKIPAGARRMLSDYWRERQG